VAYIIASQPSPGEILQTGDTMSLLLGHYPPSPPGGEHTDLISRLNAANMPTQMVHNIQHSRWTKLLINGCYATVCAATGLSTLAVAEAPGGMELLLALGHEIRETAAAADGCEMSVQEVEGFFREKMRGLDLVPSMLQDARRGVGMEVEALCGNIVRIAERCGVQTPRLR
jgi:2-dehydropantoate 2-reductase